MRRQASWPPANAPPPGTRIAQWATVAPWALAPGAAIAGTRLAPGTAVFLSFRAHFTWKALSIGPDKFTCQAWTCLEDTPALSGRISRCLLETGWFLLFTSSLFTAPTFCSAHIFAAKATSRHPPLPGSISGLAGRLLPFKTGFSSWQA